MAGILLYFQIIFGIFFVILGSIFILKYEDLIHKCINLSFIFCLVCGLYVGIQYLATAIFGIYNAYGGEVGAAWGLITVIFMIITLPIFGNMITERFEDVPRNDPEKYYFEIQVRDYEYGMFTGFWLLTGFLFFAIGYFYLVFVAKV